MCGVAGASSRARCRGRSGRDVGSMVVAGTTAITADVGAATAAAIAMLAVAALVALGHLRSTPPHLNCSIVHAAEGFSLRTDGLNIGKF